MSDENLVEVPDQQDTLILFANCCETGAGGVARLAQRLDEVFDGIRAIDGEELKDNELMQLAESGIPIFDMLSAQWKIAAMYVQNPAAICTGDEVCDALLLEIERRYGGEMVEVQR